MRVGLGRIVDPFLEVGDPAGRTIGPGHVGAGHEGVVFAGARRERRRHLVEIDIFGEDVIGDFDARQVLEGLQVGNHRVGIGVLVQKQLQRLARMHFPVEIGGQRLRRHGVQQCSGGRRRHAHGAEPLHQAAAVHLSAQKCADKVFFLLMHCSSSPSTGIKNSTELHRLPSRYSSIRTRMADPADLQDFEPLTSA